MGKKGDLLRAAKADKVMYHFTKSQLEEHDRFIWNQAQKSFEEQKQKYKHDMDLWADRFEKDTWERVNEEWKNRNELFNNDIGMARMVLFVSSLSVKVLCDYFGWKSISGHYTKTQKFCEHFVAELNKIFQDENADIREVAQEIADDYGVSLSLQVEDE